MTASQTAEYATPDCASPWTQGARPARSAPSRRPISAVRLSLDWVAVLGGVSAVVLLTAVAAIATLLSAPAPYDGRPAAANYVEGAGLAPLPSDQSAVWAESTGGFDSVCGLNQHHHENADNVIVAPRSPGAAHHVHEYVGNLSTGAFSTDDVLARGGTTCGKGDRSAYYWPVLRALPPPGADRAARLQGEPGETDGNIGTRVAPERVLIEFRGSADRPVVGMPRFLRLVTGDAHAATAGPAALGRAAWSCSQSPDRPTQLYPLCPEGQQVVRTFDFPSCWDGQHIDSDTHRTHAVFPGPDGACPANTYAIPHLRMQVTYTVPPGRSYAIDTFPDQRRSPKTDHADFINVMPDALMQHLVACINTGRRC